MQQIHCNDYTQIFKKFLARYCPTTQFGPTTLNHATTNNEHNTLQNLHRFQKNNQKVKVIKSGTKQKHNNYKKGQNLGKSPD